MRTIHDLVDEAATADVSGWSFDWLEGRRDVAYEAGGLGAGRRPAGGSLRRRRVPAGRGCSMRRCADAGRPRLAARSRESPGLRAGAQEGPYAGARGGRRAAGRP